MSRILFVTPHAGGNVPPTVAIARELLAGGHEVRVLGHPGLEQTFAGEGIPFRPFRHARSWNPITTRPSMLTMLGWLRLASERAIARDVRDELANEPADVVVVDCMVPVALRAARASGAHVMMLMHAFSGYWAGSWSWRNPLGFWLRVTHTHPAFHPADSGLLLTDPELDLVEPGRMPVGRVLQTGPVVPAVKARSCADSEAPILLSFSTISYPGQREALQRTLDALGELSVATVATIAPGLEPEGLRVPANVEVRGLVPHAELLPSMRLVIGHGGHGTTMAALAHGLPVLVIAMSSLADQPLVGAAVERAGVGMTLPRSAPTQEISQALAALLADPGVALRARALGAGWGDGGPIRAAASAIVEAASPAGRPGSRG